MTATAACLPPGSTPASSPSCCLDGNHYQSMSRTLFEKMGAKYILELGLLNTFWNQFGSFLSHLACIHEYFVIVLLPCLDHWKMAVACGIRHSKVVGDRHSTFQGCRGYEGRGSAEAGEGIDRKGSRWRHQM
jgi:hypothetical protein